MINRNLQYFYYFIHNLKYYLIYVTLYYIFFHNEPKAKIPDFPNFFGFPSY